MRTIAHETAFQIALRNCSKEVGISQYIYVILVRGGRYMQSSTYFLKTVSAGLVVRLTVSHEEQTSP